MSVPRTEVLVVGGGVIGLAVADALSGAGVPVVVLERTEVGRQASAGAAGLLAPLVESAGPGPFLELALAGRAAFAEEARLLQRDTGVDIGYRESGTLRVAEDDATALELRARVAWERERGLAVRYLEDAEVRALEPALGGRVRGALYSLDDHQVTADLLAKALALRASRRGATLVEHAPVSRLLRVEGAVVGVRTADGNEIRARTVVLAAGPWSSELSPVALPVRPVKGQLAHLRPERSIALARPVFATGVYLVPKSDYVVVGATEEDAGFDISTSEAATERLVARAREVVPSFGGARVVAVWAGLRPGTPDRLPILGRHPAVPGLVFATGHFRNGILLSLVTGRIVAALVAGAASPVDIAAFSPDRFAARSAA